MQDASSSALAEQFHPASTFRGLSDLSHLPGANNPQEIYNFLFFRAVTAPSLAGGCDFGFWTRYTLQAAHLYPPLWHATAALGAIHCQHISDRKLLVYNGAETAGRVQFALRQFNKSIQSLMRMFLSGKTLDKQDKVVVLTSCILFTCLCTLQNSQMQALMHINYGIKLIHQWRLGGSARVHQNDDDVAINMLQVMFTQLDTQAIHIRGGVGMHTVEQTTGSQSVYTLQPFSTCLQAYVEVEKLINRLIRLDQNVDGASITQKEACSHDFTLWDTRFQGYLATKSEVVEGNLVTVLNIRRLYAQTLLNDPAKGELGHDEFFHQYTMIVTLAEQILEAQYPAAVVSEARTSNLNQTPKQLDFSLSVAISEAILMTIIRCRKPSIRYRALQLLKTYPHREGIMNGPEAREILTNYIFFEEQACTGSPNDGECSSVGLWICQRHRVSFHSFMQISRLGVQGMQKWRI
jgi:hypothetical protein